MTTTIGIILPTILLLVVLVAAVLNFARRRRWFNLLQALGVGLCILPNGLRLLSPTFVGVYDSLVSQTLGYGWILGAALFAIGYLTMATNKSVHVELGEAADAGLASSSEG